MAKTIHRILSLKVSQWHRNSVPLLTKWTYGFMSIYEIKKSSPRRSIKGPPWRPFHEVLLSKNVQTSVTYRRSATSETHRTSKSVALSTTPIFEPPFQCPPPPAPE
ncbi:hypothetical protein CDAR_19551 [Caerostris darwini]|uniref:Uncharacterized protein n=1 Tax=Caerostris darwini TaxID=1538125 RepID=A0AAV4WC21_9ARAC|nr:hypothetical protein CDAR_19551 [Caerostris darwini]